MNKDAQVVLSVKDITQSFGPHKILCGIDLDIKEGSLVCIIGTSGCGKSVFVRTAMALPGYRPKTGSIDLYGIDLLNANEAELESARLHVGYVFQLNALYSSETIFDNCALFLRENTDVSEDEIYKRVASAIESVELQPSVLTKKPSELSGGMQKRVAIAREIVRRPDMLIFDEPTTGLDNQLGRAIDSLIVRVHDEPRERHRTTLVITHDLRMMENIADRIIMLSGGVVHFDGTWDEFIMKNDEGDEVIADYLHAGNVVRSRERFVK